MKEDYFHPPLSSHAQHVFSFPLRFVNVRLFLAFTTYAKGKQGAIFQQQNI